MLKYIKILSCSLILYFYIYSPALVIMPFGLDKLILAFSLFYILISGKVVKYINSFKPELALLLLIALFSVFVTTIHNGFSLNGIVLYDIFLFVEILAVPYALLSLFGSSWKCNVSDVIIYNSMLAGCITVALLLNPAWADIMKNQLLRIPELLTTNFSFRGFGFSDGLTFAYPVVQGLCAAFVICGFIRKKPLLYWGLVPIIVSVFVNARSGIIPIGVALAILVFKSPLSKTIKTVIPIVIVLFLMFFLYKPNNNSQLSESVEWGLSFFQIMGDLFSGEDAENMDALSLTGTMVQFPHSISACLIGEGVNIFEEGYQDYNNSDIGFCIRSVYGGYIYMSLWIILWFKMYRRLKKSHYNMALLLFISLIYLNWKSDFFIVTASCRFFFFIYVCCLMDQTFMRVNNKEMVNSKY